MNTTLDLFEAATVALTRPASIKDRIADAYRNYLALVDERDLPPDVCEEFRALIDTLTRVSPQLRGDDAVRATIRKMSNEDALEATSAVVRMYGAVSRASMLEHFAVEKRREEEEVPAESVTNVVPLHLAAG